MAKKVKESSIQGCGRFKLGKKFKKDIKNLKKGEVLELLEPTVSGYDTVLIYIKKKGKKYQLKFHVSVDGDEIGDVFILKRKDLKENLEMILNSTEFYA